ncbi:hypothetical protein N7461_002261 [Penicillium sp. DV-2018c]|nr:hypothetical protein N7461_002261 [Penicillium sp. DV-2018c]
MAGLRQALADLKSAIRSVNSLQTTSRFIGIFADLSDQAIEVQLAVQSVARGTPLLEDQVARDMKKAQAAIEALSNEDRRDLQRFYAKDLLVYLEMDIPPDLETGLSKNVSRTQTTLFDIKHLHRALARVCGVEACIGDMASGLRCVQDFKRGNRAEVSRLLEQRTKAVGELHEQFLELTREERDLLWLWYGDVMVGVGIQREAGTAV